MGVLDYLNAVNVCWFFCSQFGHDFGVEYCSVIKWDGHVPATSDICHALALSSWSVTRQAHSGWGQHVKGW